MNPTRTNESSEEQSIDFESRDLGSSIGVFLDRLADKDQPGRFLPCAEGATPQGRAVQLAFSCFAAKTEFTLGLWEKRPPAEREEWIRFIQSFQQVDAGVTGLSALNPFVDPGLLPHLELRPPVQSAWKRFLGIAPAAPPGWLRLMAENKQAIATLHELGSRPLAPFGGAPLTEKGTLRFLRDLDWQRPWAAGAQASVLAVLFRTEAPPIVGAERAEDLRRCVSHFLDTLADPESGAYFRGSRPKRGQTINGAMKVLTALDWLEKPIHYPEKLIDTVLRKAPKSEGCHVVDAIYILDRCLQETGHRRAEIEEFGRGMMGLIAKHFREDGGFSYYVDRSQIMYQSVPIAEGRLEGDIHATCLLTWAIAMIDRILGDVSTRNWKVIRP